MPESFDSCVKNGGRVRTRKLKGGRTLPICFLNGKSYPGYVRKGEGDREQRSKGNKYTRGLKE